MSSDTPKERRYAVSEKSAYEFFCNDLSAIADDIHVYAAKAAQFLLENELPPWKIHHSAMDLKVMANLFYDVAALALEAHLRWRLASVEPSPKDASR